jgi:hypothetical protein
MLFQAYARQRDLFLRSEMRRHFLRFFLELQILLSRYDEKREGFENMKGSDLTAEERRRNVPERLYSGIIEDAKRCLKAKLLERERCEREEMKRKEEKSEREQFSPDNHWLVTAAGWATTTLCRFSQ